MTRSGRSTSKAKPLTTPLDPEEATRLAAIFKPLADPSRVALISALADAEVCVHELADQFGMEQSAVSHQQRILRAQNLVTTRRLGRHIYYTLTDTHVRGIFEYALEHVRHPRG